MIFGSLIFTFCFPSWAFFLEKGNLKFSRWREESENISLLDKTQHYTATGYKDG